MRKEAIKQFRNRMMRDLWNAKKASWEMKDVAYIFGLSIPQFYRILKEENIKVGNNKK